MLRKCGSSLWLWRYSYRTVATPSSNYTSPTNVVFFHFFISLALSLSFSLCLLS